MSLSINILPGSEDDQKIIMFLFIIEIEKMCAGPAANKISSLSKMSVTYHNKRKGKKREGDREKGESQGEEDKEERVS